MKHHLIVVFIVTLATLRLVAGSPEESTDLHLPGRPTQLMHGTVEPGRQVTISSPFDGVLMTLGVREGDRVSEGQVLAVLDDEVARAAVEAARAAASANGRIVHAELELDLAERHLVRLTESRASQAASVKEMDEARFRRDQARATLTSARQARMVDERNLLLEEARLRRHTIRAPFAGVVTRVYTDVGATVTGPVGILQLISIDTLRAEQYLPAEFYHAMEIGREYSLEAGTPVGGRLVATLRFVEPIIDPATRCFRCVFELENPQSTIPAGVKVRMAAPELVQMRQRAVRMERSRLVQEQ